MTDRPILFSAPMVIALLAGTKTQTRRAIKPRGRRPSLFDGQWSDSYVLDPGNAEWAARDIPFSAGDRLWVRETYTATQHDKAVYRADARDQTGARWSSISVGDPLGEVKWKPSIFMPRRYSRLTLYVTDVRVERLQDISEADARAEGAGLYVPGHGFITEDELRADPGYSNFLAPRLGFEVIWTEINGAGSWAENPWVAAYAFAVRSGNIDSLPATLEEAA